jgi:GNAT superfamily N-acetyltransferase
VTIRPATVADALAIAEVHVHSWQWAYRGLIPDDYLDRLSIQRGAEVHTQRLAIETGGRTWVADQEGQVIGFATTGPSRDPDASPRTAEIGAMYLRREAAGTGVARALFVHAIQDLWQRGYEEATLWVLDNNARARKFYEKVGWFPDGTTKTEERPGALLHEVRYRTTRRPEDTIPQPPPQRRKSPRRRSNDSP